MPVFTKNSLTIQQKIAHLQASGMTINDIPTAEHWLQHVSYYRLSAYWLPFETPKMQPGPRFPAGTTFDTVTALYQFDRKLRIIVLDAIERIEVAVRGSWAYTLAHQGGPHGYLDAALYQDRKQYHENLSRLVRDVGSSPETYIDHYRRNYDNPPMPPVWMVAEMMSFGQISRWISSLKNRGLRSQIAVPLAISEKVMIPLLKHLSTVRNTCAHHGRLWNRGFLIRPALPLKPADLDATLADPGPGPASLYNSLVLINFLIGKVDPASTWKQDIQILLATHPTGNLAAMGFPNGWAQRPLWL